MPGYGTNAGGDAYFAARSANQSVLWLALTDNEKTAARLNGSEYLDNNYSSMFPGFKTGQRAQERQWPRTGAYDQDGYSIASDVVPVEVEYATYELAIRAATTGPLVTDFVGSEVVTEFRIEGAISAKFGGSGSISDAQTVFTAVDAILSPILTGSGGGNMSSLVGRVVRS